MTRLTLRYDDETYRITQTYWGNDDPEWADKQRDGETVTTTETTQQARTDALTNALNSVEAGTDYNPDTETAVGKLCYDPDADELYAEVKIQLLPDQS
ncbi:hypothetical protein ACFQMF_01585 [Halorubrum rutilum]|uniref:DUF2188 domain-containing protein n=1 Tax=Halorubrum rutilum TaxID=1364933 RepID=A0ABD6AH40_9EURY|nr:hypothetical protein [Halorubrum rutilum]